MSRCQVRGRGRGHCDVKQPENCHLMAEKQAMAVKWIPKRSNEHPEILTCGICRASHAAVQGGDEHNPFQNGSHPGMIYISTTSDFLSNKLSTYWMSWFLDDQVQFSQNECSGAAQWNGEYAYRQLPNAPFRTNFNVRNLKIAIDFSRAGCSIESLHM